MRMFEGLNALSSLYLLFISSLNICIFSGSFLAFALNLLSEIQQERLLTIVFHKSKTDFNLFWPAGLLMDTLLSFMLRWAVVRLTFILSVSLCSVFTKHWCVTLFYSLIPIHYVGVKYNILIMTDLIQETRHKNIGICSLIHHSSSQSAAVLNWTVQRTPLQTQTKNWFVKYLTQTVWSLSTKERKRLPFRTICCKHCIQLSVCISLNQFWLLMIYT